MPDTAPGDATAILQRLLRVPPPQFVAERNTVAKALRADGDKDLAAAVATVRRPGVSDWALDVAAAEHADDVAELVEAATEVLDAQEAAMAGRDGGDLRIRLKLLRVCTATVAGLTSAIAERHGQTGSGSSVMEITSRLSEIAGNRHAIGLLARGLLGAEDPGTVDPFGIADAGGSPPTARHERARPATRKPAADAAGPSAAELKQRRSVVSDAKRALAAAEAASAAADRALAKQETAVATAEARVLEAEQQLEARRDGVREAKAALDELADRREAAAADVNRAEAALAAAEHALAGG